MALIIEHHYGRTLAVLWIVLTYPLSFFRRRHDLALEVLALRHQLMVLERQTRRPRLRRSDRCFCLLLMRPWPNWRNPLIILQPETPHRLATSRIQDLLAMEVQTPTWAARKGRGTDPAHPPDVECQPDLGQSARP